jgi:S1-C subfamily serine protease
LVAAVVPGSPADQAGFRAGDVMTSVDGISFAPQSKTVLDDFMANSYTIGQTVHYTVRRDREIIRLNPPAGQDPCRAARPHGRHAHGGAAS